MRTPDEEFEAWWHDKCLDEQTIKLETALKDIARMAWLSGVEHAAYECRDMLADADLDGVATYETITKRFDLP